MLLFGILFICVFCILLCISYFLLCYSIPQYVFWVSRVLRFHIVLILHLRKGSGYRTHNNSICIVTATCCSLSHRALDNSMAFLVLCISISAVQGVFAQPHIPDGIPSVVNSIKKKYAAIDQPSAVNGAMTLKKLKRQAEDRISKDLAEHGMQSEVQQAVEHKVGMVLRREKYVGGCVRDRSSGCPLEWVLSEDGLCAPPASYAGLCGSVKLTGLSAQELESFSLKCMADYPCQVKVPTLSGCPQEWASTGRLCMAPSTYTGQCSPIMNFQRMSNSEKAWWAAVCNVEWPCKGYRSMGSSSTSKEPTNGPL